MESFDDLDLERAPQDWQIDPALSMLPYGGISSVILNWNPAGGANPSPSLCNNGTFLGYAYACIS